MKKKVVYPGSFDPLTLGHLNVIKRLSRMFDEVIVLVADSIRKKYMFSGQERAALIQHEIETLPNVTVDTFDGLTVDYADKVQAHFLVRSIRHLNDWELEVTMAHANGKLNPRVETMFLVTDPGLEHISSTLVREVAVNRGNLDHFVTPNVRDVLIRKTQSEGI